MTKDARIDIRVPKEDMQRYQEAAAARQMTLSMLVRGLLDHVAAKPFEVKAPAPVAEEPRVVESPQLVTTTSVRETVKKVQQAPAEKPKWEYPPDYVLYADVPTTYIDEEGDEAEYTRREMEAMKKDARRRYDRAQGRW